ncbi:unnamed protein product [marine sediment metagenome]|uniref:Uncharacterized protein n=1 Tax=marine sediment metagenome TaxID=412755 RepID=X1M9V6_9ZZZZ
MVNPTGKVLISVVEVTVSAHMSSSHPYSHVKIATVAIIGLASGNIIL